MSICDGPLALGDRLLANLASEVLRPSAGGNCDEMLETPPTKSHLPAPNVSGATKARSLSARFHTGLPVGILFQANVHDGSEAAEENWAEALGLAQSHIPVQLVPLETKDDPQLLLPESVRKSLDQLTLQRVDLTRSVFYQAGPTSSWNLDFYGRWCVGRTAFSTDRIPDGWAQRCNAMDEVWVPSEFNRQTFARSGVDERKIRVMHTGVDTQLFHQGLQPLDIPHAGSFNFLSVTNGRQQSGIDVLLRAYLLEFKADEDVTLLLRISPDKNSCIDPEAELAFFIETELGRTIERAPTIIFLDAPLTQTERARLYASANAFVLPSRGESFGRSCVEALASGLPVIATQWGGTSEFLCDANSFPIAVEGTVSALCEDELLAEHRWAEPSVDDLRQHMRAIFTNSVDAQKRSTQGRHDAVERWDWSVVIAEWAQEFRRLCE
jgi:glycosyltransferase involved in cell wall biosynthesis